MDSEWIRNSIQKEGFTCTEAIIIFGDIGIVMFLGPLQCFCVEVAYEFASRFCWGFKCFMMITKNCAAERLDHLQVC